MNLNVYELGVDGFSTHTELKAPITVGDADLHLYCVRPHLYKHLAPAGSLYIQIQDVDGKKIKNSESIAISSITAVSGNYYHGYIRFLIDLTLKKNTAYNISLRSSGYTYSTSAFIGWCNAFDLLKNATDYTTPPPTGYTAPYDLELWVRRQINKGVYP